MPPKPRFSVKFAPEAVAHLDSIEKKYHRLIRTTVDGQLKFEPETQTRNRKSLEQPALYVATWELRFGPNNRLRVFYEVHEEEMEVWILAIGVKQGNRLFIGGKEFEV